MIPEEENINEEKEIPINSDEFSEFPSARVIPGDVQDVPEVPDVPAVVSFLRGVFENFNPNQF